MVSIETQHEDDEVLIEALGNPATWHELALQGHLENNACLSRLRRLQLHWSIPSRLARLHHPLALHFLQDLFDTPQSEMLTSVGPATIVDGVNAREEVIMRWKSPRHALSMYRTWQSLVTVPLPPPP